MVNFSINGFGRIGRSATRVWLHSHLDDANLVAINTSGSLNVAGWAHLLRYDTAYGILPYAISSEEVQDPKEATDEKPLIGYITIGIKERPREVTAAKVSPPPMIEKAFEAIIACKTALVALS